MANEYGSSFTEPDQQRPLIEWELKKDTQFADPTLSTRAFTNIEYTDGDISKFVDQASCYCNKTKRWDLPMRRCREDKLANGLQIILEQIMTHFDLGRARTIYNAYRKTQPKASTPGNASARKKRSKPFPSPASATHMKNSPAFSIQAIEKDLETVNNFPDRHPAGIGFAQVVSPIEVTTESNFDAEHHKLQVAYYARHLFYQQSNRQLVNCIVVSERSIRLYVFGRDGLHYSFPFNIHDDPIRFVRFILGAASMKAEVVGFDSTIFFRGGKRWIQSVDLQNNAVEYEVVGTRPIFDRPDLGGRGTTCWKVEDSAGNLFLVKDSWQKPALNQECELLQDAKGLGGVGQIVGYQNGLTSAHRLRRIDSQSTISASSAALKDKELSRIVMEYYGDTLAGFTSRKQLLEAFDDAISGYKNLHDRNILHRDISVNNILLGKPDAKFPNRGVLVDLDMAIRLGQPLNEEDKDRKAGTRAFQSVNILRSYNPRKRTLPHGYMDDLQSFFYVMCWICANYSAPGTQISTSSVLTDWELHDADDAASFKGMLYSEPLCDNVKLTAFFGKPFYTLLVLLQGFFEPYIPTNIIIDPPTLEEACATIQGYVRDTITAVELADSPIHDEQAYSVTQGSNGPAEIASPTSNLSPVQYPERLPLLSPTISGSIKRQFNGPEGNHTPSKKIKVHVYHPRSVS